MPAAKNESYNNWGPLLKRHLERSTTNSEETTKKCIINYIKPTSQSIEKTQKANKKSKTMKATIKRGTIIKDRYQLHRYQLQHQIHRKRTSPDR